MPRLAKNFQLQIMPQISKRVQPEQELETDEQSWLLYFLDRFDVTYTTPGKRDQVYIGKTDGEKLYKTNKYLF